MTDTAISAEATTGLRIRAVLTGKARPIEAKSGMTGLFKEPHAGRVQVGPTGLAGDTVVDTENHGGREQAVYVMGSVDLDAWSAELGRPVAPGTFGENIVIDGLDASALAVGDRLRMGDVVLEMNAPRIPCVTLSAAMGEADFGKRFFAMCRPGGYARVLSEGEIGAGDPVSVEHFEAPRLTMAALLGGYATGFRDPESLRAVLQTPAHAKLGHLAWQRLDDF